MITRLLVNRGTKIEFVPRLLFGRLLVAFCRSVGCLLERSTEEQAREPIVRTLPPLVIHDSRFRPTNSGDRFEEVGGGAPSSGIRPEFCSFRFLSVINGLSFALRFPSVFLMNGSEKSALDGRLNKREVVRELFTCCRTRGLLGGAVGISAPSRSLGGRRAGECVPEKDFARIDQLGTCLS